MEKSSQNLIIKVERAKSLYQLAEEKFDTSYNYVIKIATGKRTPTRGKGLEIRNYLLNHSEQS